MKLCYTVQRDNTLMDFGLWLNLKITKDSPGQLGNKVVIKLNKITRIGINLLSPKVIRTSWFNMKIKV